MSPPVQFHRLHHTALRMLAPFDVLAPLALRLYLVPVFWMAGTHKLADFPGTVEWFGNAEWGLGLPLPWLMAALATATEVGGALCLALGFATRLVALPLMLTMVVAAATVHWDNGWQAIADPRAPFANARVEGAPQRLERARELLREHGDYEWLTASGRFVVLNNGIEFAVTYFVMLLGLVGLGGGPYSSADYWIARRLRRASEGNWRPRSA